MNPYSLHAYVDFEADNSWTLAIQLEVRILNHQKAYIAVSVRLYDYANFVRTDMVEAMYLFSVL